MYSEVVGNQPACVGDAVRRSATGGKPTAVVGDVTRRLTKVRMVWVWLDLSGDLKDLRCIVFVERIITAVVLKKLLSELLPKMVGWKTEYTAGNNFGFQSQSRKEQNRIVEEFREGIVNIIVATSILEEGLDVQRCNLVIRFDPSSTVCSFIQSRGRARMQNSEFLIMVRSGDTSMLNKVRDYIASGDIMRVESLRHASLPCAPLDNELFDEVFYRVESTGAIVTQSSSVSLIYFYCSRLPGDGYFKPSPRFEINKELKICKLNFPKSCPIQTVSVEGNIKMLKQLACLEACKQLHQIGALTDNLVPDIVVEEAEAQELGYEPYVDEQACYVPPELVSQWTNDSAKSYHCYLIELNRDFEYDVPLHHILLAVRTKLECDDGSMAFGLEVDRGKLTVRMKYIGELNLKSEQVLLCQRFQVTLFRILLDHNLKKLREVLNGFPSRNDVAVFDYLLLPCTSSYANPSTIIIDWKCVSSVLFPCEKRWHNHTHCSAPKSSGRRVHTKNGLVCSCTLEDCLVYTPHNGHIYSIFGTLDDLDGNSLLNLKNEVITYKQYFKSRHGIDLLFGRESLLKGKNIFPVLNCLQSCRQHKEREASNTFVELPPELCFIIMSPLSIATLYSFSFVPSILHRIECLLIAVNLRKMHLDQCTQNVVIPTIKIRCPMSSWSALMVPLSSNSTHMSSVTPIPPVPSLGCGQGHGASFGLGSSALLNGSFPHDWWENPYSDQMTIERNVLRSEVGGGAPNCTASVEGLYGVGKVAGANYSKSVAQEWRPKPTAAIPPPRPNPDVIISITSTGGFSPPRSDSSGAIVLEAITTKKCQEIFHLESLETLGDSFLKYAASQQLFKTYQNHHEGLLSVRKDKIISNAALCKLGCDRKLPGFIRNEPFDPKTWIIPGDQSRDYALEEEFLPTSRKIYNRGSTKIKSKTVADVVEALIGAFLSTGGEAAALAFIDWLGIKVDFVNVPYERQFPVQPEKLVNIKFFESLLNYSFRDASLLVEALTHGSYMLLEIPGCYQRLEFLGDAVLDYVITTHLYRKYPGMSPGLLTDLRSASVNNECYARSAMKAGLHKHILHASQDLHKHIVTTVENFEQLSMATTFGWESETTFPKVGLQPLFSFMPITQIKLVLGDIIESLAGAILVDSGYNEYIVFQSIRPLLEPLITPETVRLHPVRELHELCQKEHYNMKKDVVSSDKGVASLTIEIEANGVSYKHTCTASDKKTAKKLASKAILKSLKEQIIFDAHA
ncbi:hypothetical protein RHGRI_014751 [Rhododendron griersonianum]|uniref:Uncharacterized protein n=1 Tax=Rhododendron griersonianum TaxID=479676 RepID=A0AAV6KAM8_9ERIC|nr:hypothetical protein RHGRI_014751 [Rhododendron griersonianum]